VRVEDMRGFSHLTFARSKDGITSWQIDDRPTLMPDPVFNEEQWGDRGPPRIVWLPEEEGVCRDPTSLFLKMDRWSPLALS